MATRWAVLAGAALLAIGSSASAQSPASQAVLLLAWEAPTNCPNHEALVEAIERLGGRPLPITGGDSLVVAVRVTHAPHWRAQLSIASNDGQTSRVLEADTCARLADATALIVALALDPDSDAETSSRTPSSSPAPSPSPPLQNASPGVAITPIFIEPMEVLRDSISLRPRRTRWRRGFLASAGIAGSMALLPNAAGAVQLRAGGFYGPFELSLRGEIWPGVIPSYDSGSRFMLYTLGLEACFVPRIRKVGLGLCSAVDVGAMTDSIASVQWTGTGAFVGAYAETVIAYHPLSWLAFRVQFGPGTPLDLPRFHGPPAQPYLITTPSALMIRGSFAVEMNLQ